MSEPEVIVGVLSLVDMSLTGSLLIIVIFSGYENFVSRIDHMSHKDWPAWMGTIDFSALKLKLLSSIVAISAIQLLKQFMALNKVSDRDLYFLIIIHVVFVVSSVLLGLADRIAGHESLGHGGGATAQEPSKHVVPSGGHEPARPTPELPQSAPAAEIQVASAGRVHAAHSPATPVKPGAPRDSKTGRK
jgi:uncharacterized protein (TIGR00645 family)